MSRKSFDIKRITIDHKALFLDTDPKAGLGKPKENNTKKIQDIHTNQGNTHT